MRVQHTRHMPWREGACLSSVALTAECRRAVTHCCVIALWHRWRSCCTAVAPLHCSLLHCCTVNSCCPVGPWHCVVGHAPPRTHARTHMHSGSVGPVAWAGTELGDAWLLRLSDSSWTEVLLPHARLYPPHTRTHACKHGCSHALLPFKQAT